MIEARPALALKARALAGNAVILSLYPSLTRISAHRVHNPKGPWSGDIKDTSVIGATLKVLLVAQLPLEIQMQRSSSDIREVGFDERNLRSVEINPYISTVF